MKTIAYLPLNYLWANEHTFKNFKIRENFYKKTDVVADELKKGEKIQLVGFGTFEVSERPAREGRNPRTGETMTIAASKAPKFKAGKALKDSIN